MKKTTSSNPAAPGIAIIGAGGWGKNLVRNFHRLGALKLVCEKSSVILSEIQKTFENVDGCMALSDALNRDDIHGVVIATPAETHFEIARESLLKGKHVYVEKPLALQSEQGRELVKLAGEQQKILMVGHLLQYHPVFIRLKEMATGGELGRINYIYSHRLNLGKIRREENILWSFAPHDISMILALSGEEPLHVLSTGGNYLHMQIADVTTTHMVFPSGLRAHIFVSWLHPFKEQKLVVVGDRKMAVFDDTLQWNDKLLLYAHEISWHNNIPIPTKAEPERFEIEQEEPLLKECTHFIDCIRAGKQPLTDGNEGVRVLKILNASQMSLDTFGEQIDPNDLRGHLKPSDRHAEDTWRKKPVAGENFFVHPSAVIDDNVTIGNATKIWHFSHVLPHSVIGRKCNIGQNVVIGPEVSIGDGCKIQNNVSVYKGVTLEDDVFCGPSMVFTNIYNPRAEIGKMDQVRPTLVKRGATIGANSTIVCGATLGKYCFVGAGAVVTRNVPDHALVIGNPAKHTGWMCRCGERLSEDLECIFCGKTYHKKSNGLVLK